MNYAQVKLNKIIIKHDKMTEVFFGSQAAVYVFQSGSFNISFINYPSIATSLSYLSSFHYLL